MNMLRGVLPVSANGMKRLLSTVAATGGDTISPAKKAAGFVVFGSLVSGTAGLGTWQAQRYFEKVKLIAERKKHLRREPVPLDQALDDLACKAPTTNGNLDFTCLPGQTLNLSRDPHAELRPVRVSGVWDHTSTMLVGRRGAPEGLLGAAPQGLASGPTGYFICTVLKLESGQRIVVNRGWVPDRVAQDKVWEAPTGPVEVTGFLSSGEKAATFSPPNRPSEGIMLWFELPVLAQALGASKLRADNTEFVMLDMVTDSWDGRTFPAPKPLTSFEGFPVMPPTHAVYATTWFSLSLFGLVAAQRLLFRKPARLPRVPKARPSAPASGSSPSTP